VRSTVDISAVNQGVFRFGMTNNAANSVAPTSGAWFEYVNATDATHWRYCYANNAAATCAATTQTVSATTWYQLEIRFVSTSAITFNLRQLPSGTLETHALTAITYDTGATNKLSPVYVCDATTTTNLICGVDYFQWQGIITTSGGR